MQGALVESRVLAMTEQVAAARQPGVVIETPRLRLRCHRDGDVADLVALAGDWEVARWLSNLPYPYSDAHGREWIGHVQRAHETGRPRAFAIALKETDRLIGGVGLDGATGNESQEPALGYWLGQPYWGKGYGREAAAAILGYGFRTLGLKTVRALAAPDNAASQKVLLACGMRRVADIDLPVPMRSGATRAPLFRASRRDRSTS